MKALQLVLTILICTALLPTVGEAQQYMMNETTWTIDGSQHSDGPFLPTVVDFIGSSSSGSMGKGDLEDFILNEMTQKHIPGLSASLVKEGEVIWSGTFGYADMESFPPTPVEEETLFYLASISKTVTATALMQLWEQGLFELDDPINDYLPFTVAHPDYPDTDITFFMVLTHTASIARGHVPGITWGGDSPISLGYFLKEHFTPGGIYYALANFQPWEPGTQWAYTDVSIALAGYLVELLSGMELEPYCQENIFTPLKMDKTSFFLANLYPEDIAVPYQWYGGAFHALQHYGVVCYPSAQLRTSAPKLIKFLSTFMKNMYPYPPPHQGGNTTSSPSGNTGLMSPKGTSQKESVNGDLPTSRLLKSDTVQLMLTPQIPHIDPSQGIVWLTFTSPSGRIFWGHAGSYYGASTQMWYCPEEEMGFVVLSNGEANIEDICTEIFLYGLSL
jgi:CubicO group peptidase (beta-lactamase class C family)